MADYSPPVGFHFRVVFPGLQVVKDDVDSLFQSVSGLTVTMETDGILMRLGKEDFNTLMNEPMLEWVNHQQAKDVVAAGGRWLDVRLPSEFESYHEDNALNIPLYFMRLKLNTLDKKIKYVMCCDTGARSSAGAFILNEKDFSSCVLQGGLNANKSE